MSKQQYEQQTMKQAKREFLINIKEKVHRIQAKFMILQLRYYQI